MMLYLKKNKTKGKQRQHKTYWNRNRKKQYKESANLRTSLRK